MFISFPVKSTTSINLATFVLCNYNLTFDPTGNVLDVYVLCTLSIDVLSILGFRRSVYALLLCEVRCGMGGACRMGEGLVGLGKSL